MYRTLTWYWRIHLAVAAAAAVAAAVLGGALIVGDSVRGSLRQLVLERLGRVEAVLLADRLLDEALAARLAGSAPLLAVRGSAAHAVTGARASGAGVFGVDRRFFETFGAAPAPELERAGLPFAPAAINATLASALGAQEGDALLLGLPRFSRVAREALMGRKDPQSVLGTLRVSVVAVLPDRGLGGFGLEARQAAAPGVFVPLAALQRALDARGQVNAVVFGAAGGAATREAAVERAATLEDRGLTLEARGAEMIVEAVGLVLSPALEAAVLDAAGALGAPAMPVQSYLANAMRAGDRLLPYSMVAAFDALPGQHPSGLRRRDGRPAPPPSATGILLNAWAAEDLGADEGDWIDLDYYVVGPREELREQTERFQVEGVLALEGLAADRRLTPDYPGIENARDIAVWDPPFPVDLGRIRSRDEAYWDQYQATPKAFVAAATGRRLWTTSFGSATSVRVGLPAGADPGEFALRLRAALIERVPARAAGLGLRPLREQGLRAAAGATDFSALFLAFSAFLIGSSALLIGLLFRLGVERRAGEIGLRLAIGERVATIRRRLLGEGMILGALGAAAGGVLAWGYAGLLVTGLRTLWRPAVGTSHLELFVRPQSLLAGALAALAVIALAVTLAVRRLVRVAPQRLLAGGAGGVTQRPPRPSGGGLVALGLAAGLGLAAYAVAAGERASPALAFGTGVLLLLSTLGLCSRLWRAPRTGALGPGLAAMAWRNCAWNPGRSVLCMALTASACFVIVLVGAHRGAADTALGRDSGAGGFALLARADVPLHQDLGRPEDLDELGFDTAERDLLRSARVYALRRLPGEDASCLNLYKPERPSVLGVPDELIRRGGFRFAASVPGASAADNPWELLARPLEPGVIPAIADANSARYVLHVGLGEDLVVQDERGEPLRLRLVALLDRSVFQGEVLVAERDFAAYFPSRAGRGYFLFESAPESAARIATALEARLGPFGFDAATTGETLAAFRVVENTYLATFQLLGGLGLLLGTLGLGVVLARNMAERRGELALLRAIGFRRARLAALVIAESAVVLLAGLASGSLAALAAAAPGLVVERAPWIDLGLTLLVVVAVGLLSSVVAVRAALAVPLLPALKAER